MMDFFSTNWSTNRENFIIQNQSFPSDVMTRSPGGSRDDLKMKRPWGRELKAEKRAQKNPEHKEAEPRNILSHSPMTTGSAVWSWGIFCSYLRREKEGEPRSETATSHSAVYYPVTTLDAMAVTRVICWSFATREDLLMYMAALHYKMDVVNLLLN
jgi:hypothetical protein